MGVIANVLCHVSDRHNRPAIDFCSIIEAPALCCCFFSFIYALFYSLRSFIRD